MIVHYTDFLHKMRVGGLSLWSTKTNPRDQWCVIRTEDGVQAENFSDIPHRWQWKFGDAYELMLHEYNLIDYIDSSVEFERDLEKELK